MNSISDSMNLYEVKTLEDAQKVLDEAQKIQDCVSVQVIENAYSWLCHASCCDDGKPSFTEFQEVECEDRDGRTVYDKEEVTIFLEEAPFYLTCKTEKSGYIAIHTASDLLDALFVFRQKLENDIYYFLYHKNARSDDVVEVEYLDFDHPLKEETTARKLAIRACWDKNMSYRFFNITYHKELEQYILAQNEAATDAQYL